MICQIPEIIELPVVLLDAVKGCVVDELDCPEVECDSEAASLAFSIFERHGRGSHPSFAPLYATLWCVCSHLRSSEAVPKLTKYCTRLWDVIRLFLLGKQANCLKSQGSTV